MKRLFILFFICIVTLSCPFFVSAQSLSDETVSDTNAKNTESSEENINSGLSHHSDVEITPVNDFTMTPSTDNSIYNTGNNMLKNVKLIIFGCIGVCDIFAVGVFIGRLVLLGNAGPNPRNRENALKGISSAGIMLALLGSITLVYALFYNILK